MRAPSRSNRKIITLVATPVAIVIAGALIWQASISAFSGTTRNPGNNWSTGSVALTDDDAGTARFQVTNMVPGQTDTKCIRVTATATVPGVVRGYTVNPVTSAAHLEDYIDITIEAGTGGGFSSCTGFVQEQTVVPTTPLAALADINSYETGPSSWAVPAGTTSRTYQVTWTFDTTGLTQSELDNLQGAQTGIDIQWELRSS